MNNLAISFVIPAYNEKCSIKSVINHINEFVDKELVSEIIVIDNGSTDDTASIARAAGARVISLPRLTISRARNEGVQFARSEIIAFLDADVLVTNEWADAISQVMEELISNKFTITGYRYGVDDSPSWIEKVWFLPLPNVQSKYLNGGNLITTKSLHNAIGGFDESLETGEDFDYCTRATAAGARIIHQPELGTIHLGYPKTAWHFIKREFWHGKGDFSSVSSFARSKVAIVSTLYLVLHLLLPLVLTNPANGYPVPMLLTMAVVVIALPLVSTLVRFGAKQSPFVLVRQYFLFYLYYLSRGAVIFSVLYKLFRKLRRSY